MPRKRAICKTPGCRKQAQNSSNDTGNSDMCITHGGGNRCKTINCGKSAVKSSNGTGNSDMCKKHGGGNRCKTNGCKASAESSSNGTGDSDMCKSHGGGNRCKTDGCKASAQSSSNGTGDSDMCIKHGGGNRCKTDGCKASAEKSSNGTGDSDMCVNHGGGNRCKTIGCKASAQKSSNGTGNSDMCITHGGGNRCQMECCKPYEITPYAEHIHDGMSICVWGARNLVSEAIQAGDTNLVNKLNRKFGFKRTMAIRMEHMFYHELVKGVPRLATMKRALDESVLSAFMGKQKSVDDPRPDYYHLDDRPNLAIHGEFDENDDHEDDDKRLRAISHHAGCGIERTYVFRVAAHMNDRDQAIFRRKKTRDGVVSYSWTENGKATLRRVVEYLNLVVERIDRALVPDESTRKVYF